MPFTVNGSAASLAPFRQEWIDIVMGVDHNGAPILSGYKNVRLEFDSCAPSLYADWAKFVSTGTSVVSVNILNQDQTSYISFSGVFLTWDRRPSLETGIIQGPWSIIINNIQP